MIQGRVRRAAGLMVAMAALIGGPILLYRIRPIAGMTAAAGSGVIALVAIAHLGIVAAVLTPLVAALRRRSRR